MSKTPIYRFVKNYINQNMSRLHMPGHKGKLFLGCEEMDITEVQGADSLYQSCGIIAESEEIASRLFGFGKTLYSTEGSSHCIRAMLYLALVQSYRNGNRNPEKKPVVLAARNVHRTFLSACLLLDIRIEWLMPEEAQFSVCTGKLTKECLLRKLGTMEEKPFAVYLTAPDYLGYRPDIKAFSEVCKNAGILLLVDNAHGAYLRFLRESEHPVDLGASMSCDSAHKTLPVLTGGAYLQMSEHLPPETIGEGKRALSLFGSTSPSYLILQSLDLCNTYLQQDYPAKLTETILRIEECKEALKKQGWYIGQSDPLRLVVSGTEKGYSGKEIGDALRAGMVECEFCDVDSVVLMITPENTDEDFTRITDALQSLSDRIPKKRFSYTLELPQQAVPARNALFMPRIRIAAKQSAGRICADWCVSCPPAVPIVFLGERITEQMIPVFQAYGIEEIEVLEASDRICGAK